uniref:Uncharacterized protein n=1 Tax=Oryza rufipogon TaxID=4529 RepID=A0A0E0NC38_ORYRU
MARLTAPRRRCCPTLAPRLGYGPSSTSAALWPLRHRLRLRSHLLLDVVVWEVRKRGVTVKDMTGVQLFVFQGVHMKTNDNGSTLENSRGVGSEEAWRDSEGHDRCPAGRLPRSSHENQ